MFRLYSPFLAPVFLPEWVEDEGGGAFTCYAFIAKVLGALKKVRGWGGRGRMHGRVSAVAVWTELYCPGNLSVASPRSLFLPLPPPDTVFLPHTQKKHINTHTCLYCLSILCAYLMFHTTFYLFLSHRSLSLSLFCLIPLGVPLMHPPLPLLSPHKQTWPVPPPSHPQLLIIAPHWCDCHAAQTVKAKKSTQSSHFHPLLPVICYPILRRFQDSVYVDW